MGNSIIELKAGDVLFAQGEPPRELYNLQDGTLEILSASGEFEGLDRGIIISKSVRLGAFSSKGLIGGFNTKILQPYRMSLRAETPCRVARQPLPQNGLDSLAASDPNLITGMLRQLYNNIRLTSTAAAKYLKLYQSLFMISDNMALIYKGISQSNAPEKLHGAAEKLFSDFTDSGGSLPDLLTARFLITDNSVLLKKTYQPPSDKFSENDNTNAKDLLLRLLKLNPAVLKALFASDAGIASAIYNCLSDIYIRSLEKNAYFARYVNGILRGLFGEKDSWSFYLVESGGLTEWSESGRLSPDFVKNFLSLLVKLNSIYQDVMGQKMTNLFPGIRKIHQSYTSNEPASAEDTSAQTGAPAVISSGVMSNSIQQIFEFSVVQKDFQKKFLKLLNEFKKMKNPFNTESEGRKIRRHITKFYWDLYKQAFIRSMNEKVVPAPVDLMLKFGYLDDELLEQGQINELRELARSREKTRDVPVLLEPEFLKLIYTGEIEPSITEMGLNYKKYLLEQEKHKSRKDKQKDVQADENVKKTLYEIEQRLASTTAICSGSTATAFPVLTSMAVKGNLKSIYTDKRKIEAITKEVRAMDFSLFYRETVLKLGEAREIIQEEVLPHFILLPIFGTRTLLWQDLVGTNKRSRGRIVVPIFFMGDLKKNLLHTFASFRWELTRTIKGAMWADPIEGGVTGEYFDYVNTYKKMSKLSQEMKEKIKERFKGLRTNRDRFADDYINWILYEKEGIMKQNNVVREIFYKHVPFAKDIRARLASMPAFTQPATRYKNIHKREVDAYKRRFKKYMNPDGSYPPEIQKFFEFLDM